MSDDLFGDIEAFLQAEGAIAGAALTEKDLEIIILQFAAGRGEQGFTEDELIKVVRWVERQLAGAAMAGLFMKGFAYLDDPTGEWDDNVTIRPSEMGIKAQEELKKLT